jgi:UDP-2,3-diacylglucosamine pyrophosphatase LpxH
MTVGHFHRNAIVKTNFSVTKKYIDVGPFFSIQNEFIYSLITEKKKALQIEQEEM